jgi:hypothetical protein
MRHIVIAATTFMLVVCFGCSERSASRDNGNREMFQRFVPVPGVPESAKGPSVWAGAFALDTVTGQLCFTYNDNVSKQSAIPLCRDLLEGKKQ